MAGQGQDLKQGVYRTPADFMEIVRHRYGSLTWDLAASVDNAQAPQWISEADNSLAPDRPWRRLGGWLWLNPPYGNIGVWAKKCADEYQHGAKILFLVPASVGSEWFAQFVHGHAETLWVRPRLVLEFLYPLDYKDKQGNPSPKAGKMNTDPYPKDLMLAVYDKENHRPMMGRPWKWK